MKRRVAVFAPLFVFFLLVSAHADLKISEPAAATTEHYKLFLRSMHCGWMTISAKATNGVLLYNQQCELGPFSETIEIKAKKGGIQSAVINSKIDKTAGKLVAVIEDKPKSFKGTWGKDKREYELGANSFVPARCTRFLALGEVDFDADSTLLVIDLEEESPHKSMPKRILKDEDGYAVEFEGFANVGPDGKVTGMTLAFPYGEVVAVPADPKEMKPSNPKEVMQMFDEKEFFRSNLGVFEIKGYGTVTFSFLFEDAPKHCARIRLLIETGYYDGKTFHRLAPLEQGGKGRILQGGSSDGQGVAGCKDGVTVPLEAKAKHDKGTIGMARTNEPNSANAQFYFNLDSVYGLDGRYTVWGRVESGMEVLEKMWADNFKGGADSTPKNPLIIEKASIARKKK
jgi:peptidylprolyl isomerase